MKKRGILFICLIISFSIAVFGQISTLKYQPFRAGIKWGIKDSIGNFVVKPSFDYLMMPNNTNFFGAIMATRKVLLLRSDTLNKMYRDSSAYKCFYYQSQKENYDDDTLVYLYKPEYFIIDITGKRITNENFEDIITYDSVYICVKAEKFYFVGMDRKTKGPYDYYYDLLANSWDNVIPDYFLVNLRGEKKEYHQTDTIAVEDIETGELIEHIVGLEVPYRKGGEFSLLNKSGNKIINLDFEDLRISTAKRYYDSSGDEISYNPHLSISDSMSWKYFSNKIDVNKFMFGKVSGKWGVIDWHGKVLIPFEFDSLDIYSSNTDYLLKGYKNGKYYLQYPGKSKSVAFDNFLELQNEIYLPVYYVIQNGGEMVNILTRRDTVQLMRWDTEEFYEVVQESFAQCFRGGKFKIIDSNLKQIVNEEYDSLQFFIKEIIDGVLEKQVLRDFSDTLSKCQSHEVYLDKPILTCKNGLWGAIKPLGEELIYNKYHSLKLLNLDGTNQLQTTCDGYIGIVSFDGKEILEPNYNGFIFPDLYWQDLNLPKSHIFFYQNSKMGVLDLNGNEIIPAKFDSIYYSNGYYIVNNGGEKKRMNFKSAEIVIDPYYGDEKMVQIVNKKTCVINGRWGVLDTLGKPMVPVKYDQIMFNPYFTENQSFDIFITSTEGKNGLIGVHENDTIIEARAYIDYGVYFPDFDKKSKCINSENPYTSSKYCIVDKSGHEIINNCDTIACNYDYFKDVNGNGNEFCLIAIKDKDVKIFDLSGQEVIPNKEFKQELIEKFILSENK